ncbi:MAG: fibronectin type III domain-containing protein [Promethearchaeota archaeon]
MAESGKTTEKPDANRGGKRKGGFEFRGIEWVVLALAIAGLLAVPVTYLLVRNSAEVGGLLRSTFAVYVVAVIVLAYGLTAVMALLGVKMALTYRRDGRNSPRLVNRAWPVLLLAGVVAGYAYVVPEYAAVYATYPASAPSSATFTAGPFVSMGAYKQRLLDPAHEMTVWWFSPGGGDFQFRYGTGPQQSDLDQSATPRSDDGKYYRVELSGLAPATRYYYTVPGLTSEVYNFTTAPVDPVDFHFAVLGDSRNGGSEDSKYGELHAVMDAYYRASGADWQFEDNVGDIVLSGPDLDSWELYFSDITSTCHVANTKPVMVAMGNHEFGGDNSANYDYFVPHPRYYSFNWSNAHLLMVDPLDGIGGVSKEQLAFIEADLARNAGKNWIFISFHYPAFCTTDFTLQIAMIQGEIEPLLEKYHVDGLFTGHNHIYESWHLFRSTAWNGTLTFVTGGGGAPIDNYVMSKDEKYSREWKDWYQNASDPEHWYQGDTAPLGFEKDEYVWGELSWHWLDVHISGSSLNITLCRWMTQGQYDAVNPGGKLSNAQWFPSAPQEPVLVHSLVKTRVFN